MNTTILIDFILPLSTAAIGWFASMYRSKQQKEKDVLANVQQIIDIQKAYIADQQNELRGMRSDNRKMSEMVERKNKSIRKANRCRFVNEGNECPVLVSEEAMDDAACDNCPNKDKGDDTPNKDRNDD